MRSLSVCLFVCLSVSISVSLSLSLALSRSLELDLDLSRTPRPVWPRFNTLNPTYNKYVESFENIRIIQKSLSKKVSLYGLYGPPYGPLWTPYGSSMDL